MPDGDAMAANVRPRSRRNLRPTGPVPLVDGSVVRVGDSSTVVVEVSGGPIAATATVTVGGLPRVVMALDACGGGRVEVTEAPPGLPLEVRIGGRVELVGVVPGGVRWGLRR